MNYFNETLIQDEVYNYFARNTPENIIVTAAVYLQWKEVGVKLEEKQKI
jgi:hypothetical protein